MIITRIKAMIMITVRLMTTIVITSYQQAIKIYMTGNKNIQSTSNTNNNNDTYYCHYAKQT